MAGKKWRADVCQAFTEEKVLELQELILNKPPHIVQTEYESVRLEMEVEKIKLRIAQKAELERVDQQRRKPNNARLFRKGSQAVT